MNDIRSRHPRLKLAINAYERLRQEVLMRDNWRCQICGRCENLQVHHKKTRSQRGDDCELNLITLCAECHSSIHNR